MKKDKNLSVASFLADKARQREIEQKQLLDELKRRRRNRGSKGLRKHIRRLKAAKRRGEGITPKGWTCTRKIESGWTYNGFLWQKVPARKSCGFNNKHDAVVCGGCHQPRYGK